MIDCHLHIGHFERSPQDTINHMDGIGACCAYVMPVEDRDRLPGHPTEAVLALAKDFPSRVLPGCCVDPRDENALDRARKYHEQGCVGFGELKVGLACNDPRSVALFKLCGELGLPVTLHFEERNYNTDFGAFEEVLNTCSNTVFIGHAQTWWANISAKVPEGDYYPQGKVTPGGLIDHWLRDYPNLYGDLSAGSGLNALTRDPDFTPGFLDRHEHKLLFATDCPCIDGKGTGWPSNMCFAAESVPALERFTSGEKALKNILHNNAARLFGQPLI